MRKLYGALLVALGLVLLRTANGSSMLQLAGVLLVLAGVAVAFLRHSDDEDASGTGAVPTEEPETALQSDAEPAPPRDTPDPGSPSSG